MGEAVGSVQTVSAVTLFAPAKINLTLEVLGRRQDGYHEIRSVMQAVSLCDCLSFSPGESLSFGCDLPGWKAEKSLVSRAAALLLSESSRRVGASVEIKKNIPLASGLGGDASDAAAVLRGLNVLWRLNLAPGRLRELAAQLGSDVPFFLGSGTALTQGRGEKVIPLPVLAKHWLAIMTPKITRPPEKTAVLYARLSVADYTPGGHTDALVVHLGHDGDLTADSLYNVFERVADDVFPELASCRQAMLAAGAERVYLAGAGPSLFSLHTSRAVAEEVCRGLVGQPVFLAETLGSGELGGE
ncbi:MAG: 4-(cytidine 5'-diphospho)-2-C-methyl-D-erythritol kinase [Dehalococcoidia bacterium]|nr:4-(cytidine 5'-diphospho)-2-C-methyl-D-erythritol kinase [Dehalococcoidia bacterium]